ncbi:Phosphoenolpyruvate synthase [subsurface metagenome]
MQTNKYKEKGMYWLDEIGQEYGDAVGKKCANLGEILKAGIAVPPGFAISLGLYQEFRSKTDTENEIREYTRKYFSEGLTLSPGDIGHISELSRELRHIVESKKLPEQIEKEITSFYRLLCDKCQERDLAVSVRSAGAKSHPGQYETYLNVKGVEQLLEKVVKVWSSIYNPTSISAMIHQGIPIEESPLLGVCVLKMVDAKSSGVCFSVEPTTGDDSLILIEGNWGLGESVVAGTVIPDKFIVAKQDLKVLSKSLGSKEKRVKMTEKGVIQEEVPLSERSTLCLEDGEVVKVAELVKKLELYFGTPQDMEWSIEKSLPFPNNVITLQTRPQVAIPKKKAATDEVIDLMISRLRHGQV